MRFNLIFLAILIFTVACQPVEKEITKNESVVKELPFNPFPYCDNLSNVQVDESFTLEKYGLKKEILPQIEGGAYCTDHQVETSDCGCQEGYSKVVLRGGWNYGIKDSVICVPSICCLVRNFTWVGDEYTSNIFYCEPAVETPEHANCDTMGYRLDRDICTVGYVGRTNDLEFCDKIENNALRVECYG